MQRSARRTAARQNGEANLTWVLPNDFDGNAGGFGDTFMVVAAAGQDMLDEGEERLRHLPQHPALVYRRCAARQATPCHLFRPKHGACGLWPFCGIKAPGPGTFSGFHAFAIGHGCRRTGPAAHALPILDESVIGLLRAVAKPRKPALTVCQGGKSRGNKRQAMPSRRA